MVKEYNWVIPGLFMNTCKMVMPGARSRTLDFIANVCDVCIITATCILSNLISHMMYSEVPTNFIFSERRQIAQIKQVKHPPSYPLDMRMIISSVTGVYKHSGPHIFPSISYHISDSAPHIIPEAVQTA